MKRQEAKRLGLKRYSNDKPCTKGHTSDRYTHNAMCVECNRNLMKDSTWRFRNPEYGKKWREANKERLSKRRNSDDARRFWLLGRYGLTLDDYDSMLERQGNVCAICQQANKNGKRLSVDHDHVTGNVRQLLCSHCNFVVGFVKDDPSRVLEIYAYLKRHEASALSA
jgi:hypothetical protein